MEAIWAVRQPADTSPGSVEHIESGQRRAVHQEIGVRGPVRPTQTAADLVPEIPRLFFLLPLRTRGARPYYGTKNAAYSVANLLDGFSSVKHVKTGEVHGWPSIEKLYGSLRRVYESMQSDRSTLSRHA